MAKLSERVKEQKERRARRPLPPSHPRRVPASTAQEAPAAAGEHIIDVTSSTEVIDLTAAEETEAQISVAASGSVPETIHEIAELQFPSSPVRAASANMEKPAPGAAGVASKQQARQSSAGQEPVAVPLEPRQVWLDQSNDLWLSECEYANVRRGGRKVISRSAVVRLALDQLRERMTPEQITDLLADREPTQSGRGRPRR